MKVNLSYGRKHLPIEVPDNCTTVIRPSHLRPLANVEVSIREALINPVGTPSLRSIVKPHHRVAISVCDITRPMPSSTLLPIILSELDHVSRDNILILIATGTHRTNNYTELRNMLGDRIVDNYKIENHNAFDKTMLEHVSKTPSGIPIVLNRKWVESDIRITTGFVEPHFFAGFSGGPKMVAPGLAAFETIMELHSFNLISDPQSTWGITKGNPVHDEIRQIANQTGVDFSVDVTINNNKEITSVHAGDLLSVHEMACIVSKTASMQPVNHTFDVVITSNSGYPLDINLYQSIKGISAASRIIKNGGTIVCAAECQDGIPNHGEYRRILKSRTSPKELLEMISSGDYNQHDQWQVQIQAQIQMNSRVYLKSSYLSDDQIKSAHLEPVDIIEDTVAEALGRAGQHATLCVLPEGPQTIPYLISN